MKTNRPVSPIHQLPTDVLSYLFLHHFRLEERTSFALGLGDFRLFENPGFWTKMLLRDFGALPEYDEPKLVYQQLYAERKRLITYVQFYLCHINYKGIMPHQAKCQVLDNLLQLKNYKVFNSQANEITTSIHADLAFSTIHSLQHIFYSLVAAAPEDAAMDIAESNKNLPQDVKNVKRLHLQTDANIAMFMLTFMAKCGAYRSLKIILDKLSVSENHDVKRNFIAAYGTNLCRDAVFFGQANMVELLLVHGVTPDQPAICTVFFREQELCLLSCAVHSLMRLVACVKQQNLQLHNVDHQLTELEKIINLLITSKANPDRNREIFSQEFNVAAELHNTIRQDASNQLALILADTYFNQEEQQLIGDILELVVHAEKLQERDSMESPEKRMRNLGLGSPRRLQFK